MPLLEDHVCKINKTRSEQLIFFRTSYPKCLKNRHKVPHSENSSKWTPNYGSYTPPRKTPSRNYISPKNTWPKLHYPEHTFP